MQLKDLGHILVTGGAGFIGSHLVDALLIEGHEVTVIDNFSTGRKQNLSHLKKKVNIIEADLSVYGKWEEAFSGISHVYHLAALADIVPSIENPSAYYQANVNGTFNVLEACKKFKVDKLIYSASSSCYGLASTPTREDHVIAPQYPYALSK